MTKTSEYITHIGFTGTKSKLTKSQIKQLEILLDQFDPGTVYFHHGDCVGADAAAHDIADELGFFIIAHPPDEDRYRAFKKANEIREPKPYLERNHDIVDESDLLIAAPRTATEIMRSGTWATVRYAKKNDKVVLYIIS